MTSNEEARLRGRRRRTCKNDLPGIKEVHCDRKPVLKGFLCSSWESRQAAWREELSAEKSVPFIHDPSLTSQVSRIPFSLAHLAGASEMPLPIHSLSLYTSDVCFWCFPETDLPSHRNPSHKSLSLNCFLVLSVSPLHHHPVV